MHEPPRHRADFVEQRNRLAGALRINGVRLEEESKLRIDLEGGCVRHAPVVEPVATLSPRALGEIRRDGAGGADHLGSSDDRRPVLDTGFRPSDVSNPLCLNDPEGISRRTALAGDQPSAISEQRGDRIRRCHCRARVDRHGRGRIEPAALSL